MSHYVACGLLVLAGIGVALIALQVWALVRHMRVRLAPTPNAQGISILKPLCGHDDDLMANLESFATLDYERFEVLLGVRDARDAAYPIAVRAARRWPERMRVVLQRGEPGLNPKVNQLITLFARARYDLIVVSDSNVWAPREYLHEIAVSLADPDIGLTTHPIAGGGERSFGALLDNAYMSTVVAPGMVAARVIAGRALVVGKSMALRRGDLESLGGFEVVKDVLAEDHVMGQLVVHTLRKRVAVAHRAIVNVVRQRSLREFCARYTRWGTIQRRSVGLGLYVVLLVLNPLPLALIALAVSPRTSTLLCVVACGLCKLELERTARRSLGMDAPVLRCAFALPVKDVLLLCTWFVGLTRNVVSWRGTRLAVLDGTVLVPLAASDSAQGEGLGERGLA
jgi:ceramide glucosyltransferase